MPGMMNELKHTILKISESPRPPGSNSPAITLPTSGAEAGTSDFIR